MKNMTLETKKKSVNRFINRQDIIEERTVNFTIDW